MKVTSADIQFLIGCTRREAERIIIDAIGRNNIDKKFKVKSSTEIEVSNIKKRLLSVNESMDGKKSCTKCNRSPSAAWAFLFFEASDF